MQGDAAHQVLGAIRPVGIAGIADDEGVGQLRGVRRDMLRPALAEFRERVMGGRLHARLPERVQHVDALAHAPPMRGAGAGQLALRVEHDHGTRIAQQVWDQHRR